MNIGFILNGEDVTVQTHPEQRLSDILRIRFKLLQTKTGCCIGQCGACSVIMNGLVVKSCLIPAFKIQGSEIITFEGFSQTEEYQDIEAGLEEAGAECCGFCITGKIMAAEALLSRNYRPARNEVIAAFQGIKCRCTEPESLVRGIMAAGVRRRRRLNERSS